MKKRNTFLMMLLLLCTAWTAKAQGPRGGFAQAPSTVVHADNTVTFNYRNNNAKQVQVDVQFAGRKDMTKGENGVWTVTLGPTAPDIYPYCFIVDGNQVMDPQCPEWFPNEGFKNSLLDMRGDGNLIHALNFPARIWLYFSRTVPGRKEPDQPPGKGTARDQSVSVIPGGQESREKVSSDVSH